MNMKNEKKEVTPVNVRDDYEMVNLGIRLPLYEGHDDSVWTKTPKEKKALRKLRSKNYKFGPAADPEPTHVPLKDNLIIRVAKNDKYKIIDRKHNLIHYQTTFSHKCWFNDIQQVLDQFDGVISYVWNGKTYRAGELPVWNW